MALTRISPTFCGISLYFGIVLWCLPASNRRQSTVRASPWHPVIYIMSSLPEDRSHWWVTAWNISIIDWLIDSLALCHPVMRWMRWFPFAFLTDNWSISKLYKVAMQCFQLDWNLGPIQGTEHTATATASSTESQCLAAVYFRNSWSN